LASTGAGIIQVLQFVHKSRTERRMVRNKQMTKKKKECNKMMRMKTNFLQKVLVGEGMWLQPLLVEVQEVVDSSWHLPTMSRHPGRLQALRRLRPWWQLLQAQQRRTVALHFFHLYLLK
jgi:hypothetical protein